MKPWLINHFIWYLWIVLPLPKRSSPSKTVFIHGGQATHLVGPALVRGLNLHGNFQPSSSYLLQVNVLVKTKKLAERRWVQNDDVESILRTKNYSFFVLYEEIFCSIIGSLKTSSITNFKSAFNPFKHSQHTIRYWNYHLVKKIFEC